MRSFAAAAILLAASGCTSAQWARKTPTAYMVNYKVALYSGGYAVHTWHTRGKVFATRHGDGYYFVDRVSGRLIEVSGTVVIEQD